MTTASNANNNREVPDEGANDEYIPNANPASATVANAIAAAIPNTCRCPTPDNRAASGSSATARINRPVPDLLMNSCNPTSTATAATNTAIDRYPTESPSTISTDPDANAPVSKE
ncbi:hypothetical protein GCM10009555_045230 [Acrocarpospora macrocephala]|uniref:Uncharacterized protein n=1 Tax=Acrocarpospora macrocephala TaxID=150177 RepID=A0A5M3WCM4_9ACTN|nr:hypothetical protein Amac_004100 [Acrocarpospora macrocephala]